MAVTYKYLALIRFLEKWPAYTPIPNPFSSFWVCPRPQSAISWILIQVHTFLWFSIERDHRSLLYPEQRGYNASRNNTQPTRGWSHRINTPPWTNSRHILQIPPEGFAHWCTFYWLSSHPCFTVPTCPLVLSEIISKTNCHYSLLAVKVGFWRYRIYRVSTDFAWPKASLFVKSNHFALPFPFSFSL